MKKIKLNKKIKYFSIIIISLLITIFLYWPIYQKIKIQDSETKETTNIKILDLSKIEKYLPFLNINLPPIRHKFCFKNNNKVYLIHTDSKKPYIFRTDNVAQEKEIKENNVGAMEIAFRYNDFSSDEFYRKIGDNECKDFDVKKLRNLASSTIEYNHMHVSNISELDLKNGEKLVLGRILGNSFIDTKSSYAIIIVKIDFFLLSWAVFIIGILSGVFASFEKIIKKIKAKKNMQDK
jgi:hypothetical protein